MALLSGLDLDEGVAPLERLRRLRRSPYATLTLAKIQRTRGRFGEAVSLAREVSSFAAQDSYLERQAAQLLTELAGEDVTAPVGSPQPDSSDVK